MKLQKMGTANMQEGKSTSGDSGYPLAHLVNTLEKVGKVGNQNVKSNQWEIRDESGGKAYYRTFAWVEESRRIDKRMKAKKEKTFLGRIKKKVVELLHTIG